jgi:uncharacterized protein
MTSKRAPPSKNRWRRAALGGCAALAGLLLIAAYAQKPALPPAKSMARLSMPARPADPAVRTVAAVAPEAADNPRIAIVIDDLGLNRASTERAVALAAPVTLAFMAYAEDLPRQADVAQRAGHELLLHVPMEPLDRAVDMGRNGLAARLGRDEILRRLRWDLDRFAGYVGINNHMGSRFTADAGGMTVVLEELKSRGLFFLDSRTTPATVGARLAQGMGLAFAERDVFLDDEPSAAAIAVRLQKLEATARRNGTAIAIGHPHEATLAALGPWIASLQQKGLGLVPVSEIVRARAAIASERVRPAAGG